MSVFPLIAASVRTLVVSWTLDAEMKDSVESEALVIPRSRGSAMPGLPPRSMIRWFSFSNW